MSVHSLCVLEIDPKGFCRGRSTPQIHWANIPFLFPFPFPLPYSSTSTTSPPPRERAWERCELPRCGSMSMSMSIMNLYSAESWSISTALCVLSGNAEISSFSTVVWNDHCWAPGHGVCPVVNSRPSNLRQRRPDDQKYWAGDVVVSGGVDWQSADVVDGHCSATRYQILTIILTTNCKKNPLKFIRLTNLKS